MQGARCKYSLPVCQSTGLPVCQSAGQIQDKKISFGLQVPGYGLRNKIQRKVQNAKTVYQSSGRPVGQSTNRIQIKTKSKNK